MRCLRLLSAAALLALSANLTLPAQITPVPERTDWSAPAAAWWSHVQFLADDKLEGRKAGTPGYDKAVAYVEEQFKAIGLKPAGSKGYQQPVQPRGPNYQNPQQYAQALQSSSSQLPGSGSGRT